MDFVTDQLAIGTRRDAQDAEALRAAGIAALVSLAPVERPAGVRRQLALDVADRAPLEAATIDEVVEFVRARIDAGERVLIHCEMGISRSPTLALCVLTALSGCPVDQALAQVRRARPVADPHPALLESVRARYCGTGAMSDLSGNENPLGPSPRAVTALAGALRTLHRYPDKDCSVLIDRLAQANQLERSSLVLGNGACELIDLAARCLLAGGGEMLLPQPAFPAYRSAAARLGARVQAVPMAGGRYCVDSIIARLGADTRLVVIASPHNPTGSLIAPGDWQRLLAALPEDAWLLLDEAYRDYALGEALPQALDDVRAGRRVLVLRSLSKTHGLAGVRVGYGIAPATLATRMAALCPQYHLGHLAQAAALAALEDRVHVERSAEHNRRERDALQRALAALGVEFMPSAANFVLLRGPQDGLRRLEALGVRVKCMARYGLPGYLRVSVGSGADNARFLAALARLQREDQPAGALAPA